MKTNGRLLDDLGIAKFSFKNAKEILKVSWETTKSAFRMTWSLLKWFFNPTFEGINLIQRLVVFPVVEIFLGARSAGSILGGLYNDYFSAKLTEKRTDSQAFIAPNFEKLNEVITEFKIVKSLTIILFISGYAFFIELFDMLSLAGEVVILSSLSIGMYSDSYTLYAITFLTTVFAYIVHILTAWLVVVCFRMIFYFMREFNKVDELEIKAFVSDAIDYVSKKAEEATDREIAITAKQAVIESTAIQTTLLTSSMLDKSISYLQRGQKVIIDKKNVDGFDYSKEEENAKQ